MAAALLAERRELRAGAHRRPHRARSLDGVLERGIYLRDRSEAPGCAGCIRITAGVVEHTRRVIAAIEEVLCAAA